MTEYLFKEDILRTLGLSVHKDKYGKYPAWRTVLKRAKRYEITIRYDPFGRAFCVPEDLNRFKTMDTKIECKKCGELINIGYLKGWKQISKYTGIKSSATLGKLLKRKGKYKIPIFKVGGSLFANPITLDEWLSEQQRFLFQKKTFNFSLNRKKILRLRFEIFKRDGFACQYCGRSPRKDKDVQLQIDHVYPEAKGGKFVKENLITSCSECNLGKGDLILEERKKGE